MGRAAAVRGAALLTCTLLLACALASAPAVAQAPPSTSLPTRWTTPQGWLLRPAGTQVLTEREPTGVALSASGGAIYTVSSGIFDEGIERIDARTLAPAPTLVGDLWLGVAPDGSTVFAAGGAEDRIYRFTDTGAALLDSSSAGPAPSNPASGGTPVLGWVGELALSGTAGPVKDKLFAADNLSLPQSAIESHQPAGGACPEGAPSSDPICSVIDVLDVSNPSAPVLQHLIPVGRDAFGIAFAPASSTLYVANWADRTNPLRAGGSGTVSVVHVSPDGSGREVQHVAVGLDPTGVALAPDGRALAVADSGSDQVTLLRLDPRSGAVTGTRTVSVRPAAGEPLGAQPLAVTWSRRGLFVALAGMNAVEVLSPAGRPLAERVTVPWRGRRVTVRSVAYIPVGWYPDALATGPAPRGGSRLYVTNLYGMGAGPGFNGEAEPLVGSRTEGSLSAIGLPSGAVAWHSALARWTRTVVENDGLAPLEDRRLVDPASDPCAAISLPGGGRLVSRLLCEAWRGRLDRRTLHVFEIFNENKTFDSYFGDAGAYFPGAQADPSFATYPYPVTTNQHRIAEQFNLSESFYNQGFDSSVLGHQFFWGGMATPYDQLNWAQSYDPENLRGAREGGEWSGTTSGQFDPNVAAQEQQMDYPRLTIFDELLDPADNPLGLSERVYSTDWKPSSAAGRADWAPPALWGQGPHPIGGGDDETYPDTDRASLFLTGETVSHNWDANQGGPPASFGKEIGYCGGPASDCSYPGASSSDYRRFTLPAWEAAYRSCRAAGGSDAACQRAMPNFTFMVLPQNAGGLVDFDTATNPLEPTPEALVADNDYAVGEIVQGLSRSPFWKDTVVLLTEDDTQATGDHIDVSRTFLLSAGGLVRLLGPSHRLSDQHGSFASVLRTSEILLGLPPLTLLDATAEPLAQVIGDRVPAHPPGYEAVRPAVPSPLPAATGGVSLRSPASTAGR